jgi:hypothetical protein
LGIREPEISLFNFRRNALGRDFRPPPHLGFQRRDALIALTERCCNIGGLEVLQAIRVSSWDGVTCSASAL